MIVQTHHRNLTRSYWGCLSGVMEILFSGVKLGNFIILKKVKDSKSERKVAS